MVNFTQESEEMHQSKMYTPFDKIVSQQIPLTDRLVNLDRPKY